MILRLSGLSLALLLSGCGASSVQMAEMQSNASQLRNLSDRVAQLEANQQAMSEQLAKGGVRVPSGITAVPAQRRSGVYDDQPIRAAAGEADGFEQAMSVYRAGDLANAATLFEQYINQGGNGDAARLNLARYWLGDAYYNQRQFNLANRYLGQYLREAPNGEKSAAALEKLIQSLRASGRDQDASLLSQYGVQAITGN